MQSLDRAILGNEDLEGQLPAELLVSSVSYTVPPLTKKSKPKTVLSGINARFPPGEMSGIMGASGAGKTTLLTLLRGLKSPGSVLTGDLLCNQSPITAMTMRQMSSLVPQEDVYLVSLTSREVLDFAAQLRLPFLSRVEDRRQHINRTLSLLKLEGCADTRINSISGGEKKRLSIGLSIIGGLPRVLLCDEPTSGLDSAVAKSVVSILKEFTQRGVTVLCTIHQPSYAIFSSFTNVLLLQKGMVAYHGQVKEAEAYFAKFNSATPKYVNPADHYVTVIQEEGDVWINQWLHQDAHTKIQDAMSKPTKPVPSDVTAGTKSSRSSLTLLQQTVVLSRRNVLENFRNKNKFMKGIHARLGPSIVIGVLFWQIAAKPKSEMIVTIRSLLFITVQNPLIDTFYAGATTFQSLRGLLKREYYDGLYDVVPFYISYYYGFCLMQVPWTLAWALPMYIITGMPLELSKLIVFVMTVFMMILWAGAMGSAVGTWTKDQEGNRAVLLPMMILAVLLSGFVIPYAQLHSFWLPFYYASPVQWCLSILEKNLFSGMEFAKSDARPRGATVGIFTSGDEFLEASLNPVAKELPIPLMFAICAGYIVLALLLNFRNIWRKVLNALV